MKHICLTGATGKIGRYLVPCLLDAGFFVTAVYRDGRKRRDLERAVGQHKNIEYLMRELVEEKMPEMDVDVLIHAAGLGDAEMPYSVYHTVNVAVTQMLLEEVHAKRIIYLSSVAVYGYGEELNGKVIDEAHVLNPKGNYARSKVAAEKIMRKQDAIILRLGKVVFDHPKGGRRLMIDPGTILPTLDQNSLCMFLAHISQAPDIPSGTYNVVGGEYPTMKDYLERTGQASIRLPKSRTAFLLLCALNRLIGGRFRKLRPREYDFLTRRIRYDVSKARSLGWNP